MTGFNINRWLLVAIAVLGLAFAAPVVSAHGDAPTPDDAHPHDGTDDGWPTWMDGHDGDHHGDGHDGDHHGDDHDGDHHADGHDGDHHGDDHDGDHHGQHGQGPGC